MNRRAEEMGKQAENLRAELLKIGIRTDQDLRDAIASLPPLRLHIMTGVIESRKGAQSGYKRKCDLCS